MEHPNLSLEPSSYTLYPQRWLVLASFALLSMSSAWLWITWSPIAELVADDLWKRSISDVDALAGVYLYVYMTSFLSLYLVVHYLGLYRGLLVGAAFNTVGAAIRYFYVEDYRMVYFGTLLAAYAQTYTLSTPPLIAGSWFGAGERGTATALGVLANQMGTAIGLGATIVVDFGGNDGEELRLGVLRTYLGVQVLVAILAVALVAVYGGDKPPTPPSLAADLLSKAQKEHESIFADESTPLVVRTSHYGEELELKEGPNVSVTAVGYLESVHIAVTSFGHLSYILSFGMTVGVYYTLPAFLSQLLPDTWSTRSAGLLGLLYQFMGIVGSFGSGLLVDWSQQHRLVCLSLLALAVIGLSMTTWSIGEEEAGDQSWSTNVGLLVGIVLSGVALAAWNTVGLEYGTALTYPADEAAIAGLLECAAELLGFAWVSVGGCMIETEKRIPFVSGLAAIAAVSFLLLWSNNMKIKRPSH